MTPCSSRGGLRCCQLHFSLRTSRQSERVRGGRIEQVVAFAAFSCRQDQASKLDLNSMEFTALRSLPLKNLPSSRPFLNFA